MPILQLDFRPLYLHQVSNSRRKSQRLPLRAPTQSPCPHPRHFHVTLRTFFFLYKPHRPLNPFPLFIYKNTPSRLLFGGELLIIPIANDCSRGLLVYTPWIYLPFPASLNEHWVGSNLTTFFFLLDPIRRVEQLCCCCARGMWGGRYIPFCARFVLFCL
ncbi:hypothetical protein EJ08DRAFT_323457 [Tothia fuscella]|uniref:Uncharacterized protein n=1 Tax=Tothia fuscella TaxID=1048955 RepID=A0A9P4NNR9_9PEZI|nr:hypothetical protein EJ08DRAFT_323457 [Tothia fuscella]